MCSYKSKLRESELKIKKNCSWLSSKKKNWSVWTVEFWKNKTNKKIVSSWLKNWNTSLNKQTTRFVTLKTKIGKILLLPVNCNERKTMKSTDKRICLSQLKKRTIESNGLMRVWDKLLRIYRNKGKKMIRLKKRICGGQRWCKRWLSKWMSLLTRISN